MALAPGDVILVWDRGTRPPKHKRLICIDPGRQLFLRINFKALFRPHHPLSAAESDFLDHDSFVELRQLVRPFAYDIAQARNLGRLTARQTRSLLESVEAAETLSDEQKELIRTSLLSR